VLKDPGGGKKRICKKEGGRNARLQLKKGKSTEQKTGKQKQLEKGRLKRKGQKKRKKKEKEKKVIKGFRVGLAVGKERSKGEKWGGRFSSKRRKRPLMGGKPRQEVAKTDQGKYPNQNMKGMEK